MRLIYTSILFLFCLTSFATHNRAGEITYEHVEGYKYKFTILTYTYTPSLANAQRDYLLVSWGDGTLSEVERIIQESLPDDYDRNTYVGYHTFPGPGTFEVIMSDPNRNLGVENIPNSVNVVFSIKTILLINPEIGNNSTPVLTNPPVDWAAVGQIFIHNPAAFDPDGDSLSYKLGICLGESGENIPGYEYPEASTSLYVNSINGDLVWDAPVEPGIYNIAMFIEEWRRGIKIGKIVRDMQIEVKSTNNKPPIIEPLEDTCVLEGTLLEIPVYASDPDGGMITLSAFGGPLLLSDSPALFPVSEGDGTLVDTFVWQTVCAHVRKNPYQVVFKVKDDGTCPTCDEDNRVSLVDQKNLNITVVGPAPENLVLTPTSTSIFVDWDQSSCDKAVGYFIYRRISYYGFVPEHCETGVPAYTGYTLVATVDSLINTSYLDNNNGIGLPQGYEYCYMVTAFYPDGAESYASEEICTDLVKGIPTITNVDVIETDPVEGIINVIWSKPTEFDTLLAPGPYRYLIYRSEGYWGESLVLIDSLENYETDTTYLDSALNTFENPYSYKIEFWNVNDTLRFLIGSPHVASSVFINLVPDDNAVIININKNVPWIDTAYVIYRKNNLSMAFDSIGTTPLIQFRDSVLQNGEEYCYKVKTAGGYDDPMFVYPIINNSQISCCIPADTTAPCKPQLFVTSLCDSMANRLAWTNPNHYCCDDVVSYKIYYKPVFTAAFTFLTAIMNVNDTLYFHYPENTIAGCYVVTAVDSFNNESAFSNWVCVDECTYYVLPNVFTPNGDGINDLYKPGPYKYVDHVEMKIFDRWGILVYETTNPDINWDGSYMKNGKMVTTGVYYYICDVYENRLTGIIPRNLVGFIHIFAEEKTNNE